MLTDAASPISQADAFIHLRLICGMGVSLCLARLLTFVGKFIQHPGRHKFSMIHSLWIAYILMTILEFWWNYLIEAPSRSFNPFIYIMDVTYVFGMFLLCVLITPDDISDYSGYDDYIFKRKITVVSLNAFLFISSMLDYIYLDTTDSDYDIFEITTTGIVILFILSLMLTKSRLVHKLILIFLIFMMALDIFI